MISAGEILNLPPHPNITMKKLREAIDKHQKAQDYDFFGFTLKISPALQGTQTLVISDDKAHYWPDILDTENVKIIELPLIPEPSLSFDWIENHADR